MNNFVFYSPTEFVIWQGYRRSKPELLLKSITPGKVMIVYGGGSIIRQRITATHRRVICNRPGVELCKTRRYTA